MAEEIQDDQNKKKKNKKARVSGLSIGLIGSAVVIITVIVILLLTYCQKPDTGDKVNLVFLDGERELQKTSHDKGTTILRPADSIADPAEGFEFVEWYKEITHENVFTFPFEINEHTNVYAQYRPIGHVVTYEVTFYDGTSVIETQTIEAGELLARPNDPTKDGFIFVDWYQEPAFTNLFVFDQPVSGDLSIYAKFDIDETDTRATINYYGLNEKLLKSVRHDFALPLECPTDGDFNWIEPNHDFLGWHTSASCTTEFSFPYTCASQEVVNIYGKYQIHSYDVTFKLYNGEADIKVPTNHGSTVTPPANPSRTNFVFSGWYTAETGGVLFPMDTPIVGAITLHAHYVVDDITINITGETYILDQVLPDLKFTISYAVGPNMEEAGLSNFRYEVKLNDVLFEYIKFKDATGDSITGTWVTGVENVLEVEWKPGKNPKDQVEHAALAARVHLMNIQVNAKIDVSYQTGVAPSVISSNYISTPGSE